MKALINIVYGQTDKMKNLSYEYIDFSNNLCQMSELRKIACQNSRIKIKII